MVITSDGVRVRSAPEAAEAAGITYRMLDYWDREGWIKASHTEKVGTSRVVRLYADDVIVKLAALRHIAGKGVDPGNWGMKVGKIDLGEADLLVITGDDRLLAVREEELRDLATAVGIRVAFDVAACRARLHPVESDSTESQTASKRTRRSA